MSNEFQYISVSDASVEISSPCPTLGAEGRGEYFFRSTNEPVDVSRLVVGVDPFFNKLTGLMVFLGVYYWLLKENVVGKFIGYAGP